MRNIADLLKRTEAEMRGVDLGFIKEAAPVPRHERAVYPAFGPERESRSRIESRTPNEVRTRYRTVAANLRPGSPVVLFDGSMAASAEQYRILRTKVLQYPNRPKLILVSSPTPGDGKTVTAVNLACSLGITGELRTLLVDADLRRSSVSTLLGIPNTPGLSDVLSGSCSLQEAVIRVEQLPGLYVLPAGEPKASAAELLNSERWTNLAAGFREEFDLTILDSTPLLAVADYDLVQQVCEGVIIVIRPNHTNRKLCAKALDYVPVKKRMGVLLNCAEDWFLWKNHERYYGEYYPSDREPD